MIKVRLVIFLILPPTNHKPDQKHDLLSEETICVWGVQFVCLAADRAGLQNDSMECLWLVQSFWTVSGREAESQTYIYIFFSFFCAFAEREGAHHRQQEAGPKSGQQVQDHCQAETSQPGGEEQQPSHGAGLVWLQTRAGGELSLTLSESEILRVFSLMSHFCTTERDFKRERGHPEG